MAFYAALLKKKMGLAGQSKGTKLLSVSELKGSRLPLNTGSGGLLHA